MLLANLVKDDQFAQSLTTLSRTVSPQLSTSPLALDQLLDLFVKGASGTYNPSADFDYLSYLFADISKHSSGRAHFLTPRREGDEASVIPLSKLVVFTEHTSAVRRRGVASTIKNCAFDVPAHPALLEELDLLPYVLLPLMGPEEYADEDADAMPAELQLLPPDKAREADAEIVKTHLETLLLLTTTREGRDRLRAVRVYPIVRELHLQVEDSTLR